MTVMSVDTRTRLDKDIRLLARDEMIDQVLIDALAVHGDLAARGSTYLELPPLGIDVDGRAVTLITESGQMTLVPGIERAGVVVTLAADALSDLLQDTQSTMGLAMTSRVRITVGDINDWISWEPALRALLDGRRVHETGAVEFVDLDGGPLDVTRTFSMDDDPAQMAHFLDQAGFLHLRGVFNEDDMSALKSDVDEWLARATPDDGESWWATDSDGHDQAVRVLFFYDKSAILRLLLERPSYQQIGTLTGDGHTPSRSAEGLVKPLGIVRGLSDLPWHKDCGQGRHSYYCNALTTGISVTGADRTSGALGVIPGSHRANTMAASRDRRLDLRPLMLETNVGDVTVHCSDTLHRAHPPVNRTRHVVYTNFTLPLLPGDEVAPDPNARAARAQLTDVQARIEAADNEASPGRYRAGHGR
jgi:hypothetical protein